MPTRRPASPTSSSQPPRGTFRQRYDALESRRDALLARVRTLGGTANQHPGYKRALTLLNDTFRKAKLAQRVAVLEAAAWLIDILEKLGSTL